MELPKRSGQTSLLATAFGGLKDRKPSTSASQRDNFNGHLPSISTTKDISDAFLAIPISQEDDVDTNIGWNTDDTSLNPRTFLSAMAKPPPTAESQADEQLDGLLENCLQVPPAKAIPLFRSYVDDGLVRWEHLRHIRGEKADKIMDILDSVAKDRPICRDWMLRLHKRARSVPKSLFISNVDRKSEHPETGGAFGEIYRGKWNGDEVALKVSHFYATATQIQLDKIRRDFYREAVFWKQLVHPHILPFHGVSETLFPRRLCMICPWAEYGNILVYLESFPTCDRRKLLQEAASGMEYLHSFDPPLLHGDLKGANILVNGKHQACLCDFGLITFAELQTVATTQTGASAGSVRWKAPEILHSPDGTELRKTKATDVYAFGMTILEVHTREPPFPQFKHDTQVMLSVLAGGRPARPANSAEPIDDYIWQLITSCWDSSASSRPTATDILLWLSDVPDNLTMEELATRLNILPRVDEDSGERVHKTVPTQPKRAREPLRTSSPSNRRWASSTF